MLAKVHESPFKVDDLEAYLDPQAIGTTEPKTVTNLPISCV